MTNSLNNIIMTIPSHGRGHRFNPCRTHHAFIINNNGLTAFLAAYWLALLGVIYAALCNILHDEAGKTW